MRCRAADDGDGVAARRAADGRVEAGIERAVADAVADDGQVAEDDVGRAVHLDVAVQRSAAQADDGLVRSDGEVAGERSGDVEDARGGAAGVGVERGGRGHHGRRRRSAAGGSVRVHRVHRRPADERAAPAAASCSWPCPRRCPTRRRCRPTRRRCRCAPRDAGAAGATARRARDAATAGRRCRRPTRPRRRSRRPSRSRATLAALTFTAGRRASDGSRRGDTEGEHEKGGRRWPPRGDARCGTMTLLHFFGFLC